MRFLWHIPALAGCVAGATGPDAREQSALARDLAERVAGEPQSCVPSSSVQTLHAVGDQIVYRSGNVIWINRPLHDCSGFRPSTTLLIETHGSQYCRGDHVRALEPGTSIPGPICVLGDFVPYRRR